MPDNWREKALPEIADPPDLYWYLCTVAKPWTDGDTVTVHFDFGMNLKQEKIKMRLARIDAFGRLSTGKDHPKKAEAVQFCNMMLPEGKQFYLRTIKDKTEKWGRYLAEVYIQVDDVGPLINFNDILVKQGLALYWEGQGEHPTGEIVK